MKNWTSRTTSRYELQDTLFNRSVATNPVSLDKIAESFDTLFSNITSFKDEIASVRLYPFPVIDDSTKIGILTTMHGSTSGAFASNLGYNTRIFNMGYSYISGSDFTKYAPYTKYSLWLPWFGFTDLDSSRVCGKYLMIRLSVDYHTGQGLYILSTSISRPSSNSWYYMESSDTFDDNVIATYSFKLGIDIPLGESNASDLTRNAVLGAVKAISSVAVAGALSGTPISSSVTTTATEDTMASFARGDYKGARLREMSRDVETNNVRRVNEQYVNPVREASGSVQTGLSILGYNVASGHGDRTNDPMSLWSLPSEPHLIMYKSNISPLSQAQKKLVGMPTGFNAKLSTVGGYTKVSNVHVESIVATSSELTQIKTLLYQGVILPTPSLSTVTIGTDSYSIPTGWTFDMLYRNKLVSTCSIDPFYNWIFKTYGSTVYRLEDDGDEPVLLSDDIDYSMSYQWNAYSGAVI